MKNKAGQIMRDISHRPNISLDVRPVSQPLRRLPLSRQDKVNAELDRMVREGVPEKIDSSQWVSNMVVVPKPNGSVRICGDFRQVNKAIPPDKSPLPTY